MRPDAHEVVVNAAGVQGTPKAGTEGITKVRALYHSSYKKRLSLANLLNEQETAFFCILGTFLIDESLQQRRATLFEVVKGGVEIARVPRVGHFVVPSRPAQQQRDLAALRLTCDARHAAHVRRISTEDVISPHAIGARRLTRPVLAAGISSRGKRPFHRRIH